MNDLSLGTLDFLYTPSADVAADVRWFTEVLGAELVFAIDSGGTRVAMLRVGTDGPAVLVTDHLPDDRPIFLYRVASLAGASELLGKRGWTPDRTLELPMGPATTFHAPGGLRLAIYEPSRPFVVESMAGRRDFDTPTGVIPDIRSEAPGRAGASDLALRLPTRRARASRA